MNAIDEDPVLEGRDTAVSVTILLLALAGAATVAGIAGLAAQANDELFFWRFESSLTALLFGAGFIGALPMLVKAAQVPLWEQSRLVVLTASLLVASLFGATVLTGDDTAGEGILELVWTAALAGLTGLSAVALVAEAREPALPLARTAPLPRWTVPLVGLLGSALFGLGFALLVGTGFWGALVPWEVSTLDARLLGCFALAIGFGLLFALFEDDLDRAKPAFTSLLAIGGLGLAAMLAEGSEVTWNVSAFALLALLSGLVAVGLVGGLLQRLAVRDVDS